MVPAVPSKSDSPFTHRSKTMRGKPNIYTVQPVTLFGQTIAYEVAVNHVPVARVLADRHLTVTRRDSRIKLNPSLIRRAVESVK